MTDRLQEAMALLREARGYTAARGYTINDGAADCGNPRCPRCAPDRLVRRIDAFLAADRGEAQAYPGGGCAVCCKAPCECAKPAASEGHDFDDFACPRNLCCPDPGGCLYPGECAKPAASEGRCKPHPYQPSDKEGEFWCVRCGEAQGAPCHAVTTCA
jgi:hypothetical protein